MTTLTIMEVAKALVAEAIDNLPNLHDHLPHLSDDEVEALLHSIDTIKRKAGLPA